MQIIEDFNGERMMPSTRTAVLLGALLIMASALQGTSVAHAAPYEISSEKSCLALPGKARWDSALERCTLLDSMTIPLWPRAHSRPGRDFICRRKGKACQLGHDNQPGQRHAHNCRQDDRQLWRHACQLWHFFQFRDSCKFWRLCQLG